MALEEFNKDAISFKRLNGKAHTQSAKEVGNEFITSNVQIALTTVFGETPDPLPITNGGLSNLGDTDGIIQKVRFELEVIPDTALAPGQSQGYRLKLPSNYTSAPYDNAANVDPSIDYLYEALGRLQIVPSLYGTSNLGATEYDPILYDTNLNQIAKFDAIDWQLDTYGGILFVQDPPSGYDSSPSRPRFIDAYLYVGEYLDTIITGSSATVLAAGRGISSTDFDNDTVSVDLQSYTAPNNILMTITGSGNTFIMRDLSVDINGVAQPRGIQYNANYAPTFTNRSLVDKQYVDSIASGLSIRESVNVATTGNTPGFSNGQILGVTTIDGITLENGFRVLVKDQNDARQNGIYVWSSGTSNLTRADDFNSSSEIVSGAFTAVLTGNTNAGFLFAVSSPDPLTLNTSNIQWTRLALPLVYFGGIGITIDGQDINIDGTSLAGIGLVFDNDVFNIAISGTNVGQGEEVFKEITTEVESETYNFRRITGSGGTTVSTSGDTIVISSSAETSGTLGDPRDVWGDGLFNFTGSTPIGFAVDDINEFLASLAPPFAPNLDKIETDSDTAFVTGKLSFGSSNNDNAYTGVSSIGTTSAIDINGTYLKSTISNVQRRGITDTVIFGDLNSDIIDESGGDGIPYEAGAFKYGDQGSIVVELNGVEVSELIISTSVAATGNSNIIVSEIKFSKFSTGAEFTQAPYRTGSFTIDPTDPNISDDINNGWNYVRIIHRGTVEGSDIITNYQEWVYDPDSNNISSQNAAILKANITLTGTKDISGINYNTGGQVIYEVDVLNAYREIYSNSLNAITFPDRNNLSVNVSLGFSMDISGAGIVNESNKTDFTLPALDANASNPSQTTISIDATMPISSPTNRVLGDQGDLGSVRSRISVVHPFTNKSLVNGGIADEQGFLIYNINDNSTTKNENFSGEANRIQDEANDYTTLQYSNVNSGFAYNSTADLTGTNGMLVFDGSLYYPSSTLLNSYGINSGDFSLLNTQNAPTNPDYSSITGEKNYFRRFTVTSTATLGKLDFTVTHGGGTTFNTDGGLLNPSPIGNQIVFEFIAFRVGNVDKFGYVNPLASFDNPLSIENDGGVTVNGNTSSFSCSLVSRNLEIGDIIIVRMKFASGYSDRIQNVSIDNI